LTAFLFSVKLNPLKTQHDNKMIRCPKLGDEMTFAYCLREGGNLPCVRIIRCWSPVFDIESFLKGHLSEKRWLKFINTKAPDKITSLIELIEAAKAKK
jgi:hypothetical protein